RPAVDASSEDLVLRRLQDPHEAGAGLALRSSLALDERLARVVPLERSAVLDEPRDAEHAAVEARIVDDEVAILREPVPRVDDEEHRGGVSRSGRGPERERRDEGGVAGANARPSVAQRPRTTSAR